MNDNFAKIIAIAIVGGVAKALFGAPRPIVQSPEPKEGLTQTCPGLFEVTEDD